MFVSFNTFQHKFSVVVKRPLKHISSAMLITGIKIVFESILQETADKKKHELLLVKRSTNCFGLGRC